MCSACAINDVLSSSLEILLDALICPGLSLNVWVTFAYVKKLYIYLLFSLTGYVVGEWTSRFSVLFRIVMYVFTSMFFISGQAAAQTVIYCAVSDDILQHNGGYFSDCKPHKLQPHAQDTGIAKKLWEASETMVGLTSSPREHLAARTR